MPSAQGQTTRLVEGFTPSSHSAWKPFLKSPAVRSAADGIRFPLPFAKPLLPFREEVDRVAWDKKVAFNLEPPVAFELDLFCAHPDAIRQLGIYFKSGKGWYVANKPLLHAGRQTLTFAKTDFSTEGVVAGWDKIDAIRISPWRGTLLRNTELILHRLTTLEGTSLVVVKGSSSCPDDGERAAAAKATARISRLLIEAGIGHRIITDDELASGIPAGAKVILLPYNPKPGAKEMAVLTGFLRSGGKLGVFYGSSPELATAMGFKLGAYTKADKPDRWRSFVFENVEGWNLPERVWQNSHNLFTASPSAAGSRVLARWYNAAGQRQPEAALLWSDKGFWMTHILLSDDQAAKRDMLVALCARMDPALWRPAAARAVQQAGRLNDYHLLSQAVAAIERQQQQAAEPQRVQALLAEVRQFSPRIQDALDNSRYATAYDYARRQHRLLLQADAAVPPGKKGEFIGVWDHDGTGFIPGNWEATASLLAGYGVNAIFPNIAWGGCAHYPSKHLPPSNTLRLYGDQLAAVLAAAQKNRQQVHAWIVLWKLDGAPPEFRARMQQEGRLQTTSGGGTRPWLNPHHPANRALMLDVIEELAQQYPRLDGIHLDYVRLPDSLSCYSPATRKQYEAASGSAVRQWPADVQAGGARHADFRRWRTQDITAFMADARARVARAAPGMKLSAAVYGTAAPGGGNIAQYWPDWLRLRLVDFLTPMNYTESNTEFNSWLQTQTDYLHAAGRIIPGIGVTADESRLDPAQVARQILLARQAGCPGVVLFSLTGTLRDETLPALRQGILRPPP